MYKHRGYSSECTNT